MTPIRHPLIATLAVTVLLTVGSESSHAQKGKFRGMSNRSSFNGGGKAGGSALNFGKSTGLRQGSGFNPPGGTTNNSQPSFSGSFQSRQKSLGSFNNTFNKGGKKSSNLLQGIRRDKLQQIGGKKQNLLQSGKTGAPIFDGKVKGKLPFGNKFEGKKFFEGKAKGLQAGNGQGSLLQNHGKGHGKLLQLIQHNQKHGKVCLDHKTWCHTKPSKCHWWYNYCKPLAYCEPQHHHYCQWQYVTCDYRVNGQIVHADARWFLGLKGLLLPGQGVGVEDVAAGSPAEAVGLQPGMVITRCNGIDMVDEAALAQAIAVSGGVLQMDLLLAEGTPATCVVVMQRVSSVNF